MLDLFVTYLIIVISNQMICKTIGFTLQQALMIILLKK